MPKRKKTIAKEPHFTLGFSEDDKHEPIPLSTSLVVGGTAKDLRQAYIQFLEDGYNGGLVDHHDDLHGRWTEMLMTRFKMDEPLAKDIYNEWLDSYRTEIDDQQSE